LILEKVSLMSEKQNASGLSDQLTEILGVVNFHSDAIRQIVDHLKGVVRQGDLQSTVDTLAAALSKQNEFLAEFSANLEALVLANAAYWGVLRNHPGFNPDQLMAIVSADTSSERVGVILRRLLGARPLLRVVPPTASPDDKKGDGDNQG
jgi:hypothetical protein